MSGTYLVTGGAGFFGDVLKRRLLAEGHRCVSVDLEADPTRHERLVSVRGDLLDESALDEVFGAHTYDAIFHCAAILAHAVKDEDYLWRANVEGTRRLAERAARHGVPRLVFTSSNCVYAANFDEPVTEEEPPGPVEIYGRSKLEAECILLGYRDRFHAVLLRTPTIIDEGRLGLLAILFEFIDEGRKVWVVGKGENRYQFVYAQDLADACLKALDHDESGLFNVGSERVAPLREVFRRVIEKAGSRSRVASLPRAPTLLAMRVAHRLGLSPLGPYHYRMITSNFVFDTTRIRARLGWRPTLTNDEMLHRAYDYYHRHRGTIEACEKVSAHRRPARMGIIRLLKWLS
ncbi:MAG: NAD-dependent epimerase/dehydratase family protein [Planctomycetota bacterium]|jgi:nucleoside-diphosphate-sugar epimerase